MELAPPSQTKVTFNLGRGTARPVAGQWCFLEFGEDEVLWHERLCLLVNAGQKNEVWVLTPDGDVYMEDMDACASVVVGGAERRVPKELGAAAGEPVYRFHRTPNATEVRKAGSYAQMDFNDYMKPAEEVPEVAVVDESQRRPPMKTTLPVDRKPEKEAEAKGVEKVVEDWDRPGCCWVALRTVGDVLAGSVVNPGDAGIAGTQYGVCLLNGLEIPVMVVRGSEKEKVIGELREEWKNEGSTPVAENEGDVLRTIPAFFEADGERRRGFASAVTLMHQEEFSYSEFPTRAPRVSFWWLRDLKKDGATPKLHHNTWALTAGISSNDRSFHEHETLCTIAEAFCTVDQVNCPSLWDPSC